MSRNRSTRDAHNGASAKDTAYSQALDTLSNELHAANGTPISNVPLLPIADDGKQRRRARLEQKQQHKPERFRATGTDHK